jgi:hypothetical protein
MVRVVRILEYEYRSLEEAEADMLHWQVPAVGAKVFSPIETVRSAVIMPHFIREVDETDETRSGNAKNQTP